MLFPFGGEPAHQDRGAARLAPDRGNVDRLVGRTIAAAGAAKLNAFAAIIAATRGRTDGSIRLCVKASKIPLASSGASTDGKRTFG